MEMTRKHWLIIAGALAVAGLLVAASIVFAMNVPGKENNTTQATETVQATGSAPAANTPTPTVTVPRGTASPVLEPVAVWDEQARQEALATAKEAAAAFIDTYGGDWAQWWKGYRPFLADFYAKDATSIDPARIGTKQWTNFVATNPTKNPLTATVTMDSDTEGNWTMILERTGTGAAWLVAAMGRTN